MRTRQRQLLSFKKNKNNGTVTLTRQDYPAARAVIRCLHPPLNICSRSIAPRKPQLKFRDEKGL